MSTTRVDVLLVERGLCKSREEAQALILAGEVWSGESRVDKAGTKVASDLPLEIRSRISRFVSRSGEKLQHALTAFSIDPAGRVCLDVGASTGGFTDCLLQNGAEHVFAVDVGHGQLDHKLRKSPKVTVLEKTNARHLTLAALRKVSPLADKIEIVVMDVSFIGAAKVLVPLAAEIPATTWIILFKPQFEVGPENLGKGGVVKSTGATLLALEGLHREVEAAGLRLVGGPESSPLPGKKSGNVEVLVHYARSAKSS
jgi:23S rRNA (cytidine1920-2'-O)/16S rRNA (cytidine1409-2'-O)-methyltransferase